MNRHQTGLHLTQYCGLGLSSSSVIIMEVNHAQIGFCIDLRLSDSDISFAVKEEGSGRAVEVKRDVNINKTLELFLKPFDYLFNAEYISPQQRAANRQAAIDIGAIAPSTPLDPGATSTPPPKGFDTYS